MSNLDLSVLKSIISNKKHALEFVEENDSKLFSSDVWNFANSVLNYVKTYRDIPTQRVLLENLPKNNKNLKESISKTWDQVSNVNHNDKEYKFDLEKLKKRYAEKQISSIKETLTSLDPAEIDVSKTVGDLQKTIQNIKNLDKMRAYESLDIKDYLGTFVEKFNIRKKNPESDTGLKTGYTFFDWATNGVKPADFILIAGESGFGKSLFLNNMAVQSWMQKNTLDTVEFTQGRDVIYFSLEMPYEDCFNRLLSRLSGVKSRDIENASLSKEDMTKVKKALDFIKNYPHQFKIVDIADACANDLEKILEETQTKYDAIFVDYLGIMKTNEKSNEADWLKQGVIAYEVRAIARKYKLPIFSAVQLNRKSNTGDSAENIGLNRLARSGTIATHATHVIQIESRVGEESKLDFIYHMIKNRKGPKGKGTLWKNLACATLEDNPQSDHKPSDYSGGFDISEEVEDLDI